MNRMKQKMSNTEKWCIAALVLGGILVLGVLGLKGFVLFKAAAFFWNAS